MDSSLVGILLRLAQNRARLPEVREWLADNVFRLYESADPLDRIGTGELDLAVGAIDRRESSEDELPKAAAFVLEAAGLPTEFDVDAPLDAEPVAGIRFYLDRVLTLEQLKAALMPRLAAYRRRLSPFDRMLARELELAFAMHAAQMESEEDVRSFLTALMLGLSPALTSRSLSLAA